MIIHYTDEELQYFEDIKRKYQNLLEETKDSKERGRLMLQLSEELESYGEYCQRDRFSKLGNDPEKILQNAKEQINALIEIECKDLLSNTPPEDLKDMKIATVTEKGVFLNANFISELVRDELRLHIEALREDKTRLQELFSSIVEAVENSSYTDNTEIEISPQNKTPAKVLRYRRRPLADIKTYGLMNDKTTAMLIQMDGILEISVDGQMRLLWSVNQAPAAREQVFAYIALSYEGTETKLSKRITAYDMAVYNAVSNLFYYWKRENPQTPLYITPQEIWRVMNGKQSRDGSAKPSAAQIKKVNKSIEKMRHIDFFMDFREELKANYIASDNERLTDERITDGRIIDYLLNCTEAIFYTEQGREVIGYRINTEPALYTYNDLKKRVLYVPYDLLDMSAALSDSENVIEFKQYLLQQIFRINKGTRNNNKILLSTIYKATGIQTPEERLEGKEYKTDATRQKEIRRIRQTDRQKIEKMLDVWKTKSFEGKPFIKDYTPLNKYGKPAEKGQTVTAYKIKV